jgi:hypothetical protein
MYRNEPAIVTGIVIKDGMLLLPHRQHKKSYETRMAAANADPVDIERMQRRLHGLAAHREYVRRDS